MAGLMSAGRQLASKGRMGDSILAHINPREAALLMAHGGMGTRNPKTGLMEFWSWDDWLRMFGGGEGGDYTQTTTPTDSTPTDTTPADTTPTEPTPVTLTQEELNKNIQDSFGDTHYKVNYDYYSPELGDPVTTIRDTTGTDYTSLLPTGWDAYEYKKANEDVDWDSGIDPLEHYLNTGKAQGLGWGKNNKYSPTYDPDYQYSWQSDQDWAVPGRQKDTSYNVNIGSGDSVATDDPYETQRDESGKPITSNYKYYQQGDDLYGANVLKQLAEDGTASYRLPTTEELQASDYTGKYDTTLTASEDWAKSAWEDIGHGWKKKTYGGETYFAMPGDDASSPTYKGLTYDQIANWYTADGKNYSSDQIAWGKDPESDDYYIPMYMSAETSATPEGGGDTEKTLTFQRKLRPGEENERGWLLNTISTVLPTAVNALMSYGIGSGIVGELAGAASSAGTSGAGSGLLSGATESALPSFTEGLSSIWDKVSSIPSSISNAASNFSLSSLAPSSLKSVAVPAAIGGGIRGMQTDWDLAEMLKGAGYGALTGYGLDRLKALWDYATSPDTSGPGSFSDVLKENPDAELGDWAKDFTSTHGKFAATSPITDSARQQLTAAELYNMPTVGTDEFAGNLGYGFGGRSYDATLIPDQYVGPWQHGREDYFVGEWQDPRNQGHAPMEFYDENGMWKDYVGPQSEEDWWIHENPNDTGFSVDNYPAEDWWKGDQQYGNPNEDPLYNAVINWDQYNGGPVGLESEGILGSISTYLPSAATLGTVAKGIIAGSGSGSGDGSGSGGLDLSDLTGGGLMELFTTNPYAKRNKYKRAIQLAAQKSGMTVQEYLAANPKLQTYYYGLA